jgi:hypothetical protein
MSMDTVAYGAFAWAAWSVLGKLVRHAGKVERSLDDMRLLAAFEAELKVWGVDGVQIVQGGPQRPHRHRPTTHAAAAPAFPASRTSQPSITTLHSPTRCRSGRAGPHRCRARGRWSAGTAT